MRFTSDEGAPIALNQVGEWAKNPRPQNPDATPGHSFGPGILEQLLAEGGSKGIRPCFGPDARGPLLAVAAAAAQNDLLDSDCTVADEAASTPLHSSAPNILNS